MVWDRPRNEKKMTLENKESQEQWLRSVGHSESANVNLSVKEIPSKDTYPFFAGHPLRAKNSQHQPCIWSV